MADTNLAFAKIVSTPTLLSWSQAYNAGGLFAVLSLQKEKTETQENPEESENPLNSLGKEILTTLEQEFFSLETKDLDSIKQAILNTYAKIPENVIASFTACAFIDNILYSFSQGEGMVFLKRGDKLGEIPTPSSGFLENEDLVVLGTKSFFETIDKDILVASLDNHPPAEIAETLAPKVHEKGEGGATAIIVKRAKQEIGQEAVSPPLETASNVAEPKTKDHFSSLKGYLATIPHPKKVFLTIAVLLLAIFITSVFFAIRKQDEAKNKALFSQVYPVALKKYEEGQSLLDLNKNLAKDSFSQAKQILSEEKSKFSKNSKEEKEILALLEKVNKSLEENSPQKIAQTADKTKIIISVQNGSGIEGAAGKAADFLKEKGYKISSTGNADNYNYTGITIKTKSTTSAYLNLLRKDLSEKYTVGNTSSDLVQDSAADVLVIVGK